jgi:hypothetical protein
VIPKDNEADLEDPLVAPGCYRIGPDWFSTFWIAANELPLVDELVPFLV